MNNFNEWNIQDYLNDNFEQKVQNTIQFMIECERISNTSGLEIANNYPLPLIYAKMWDIQEFPREFFAYALRIIFESIKNYDANKLEKALLIDRIYGQIWLINSFHLEKFKWNQELLDICREVTDYMIHLGEEIDDINRVKDAWELREYAEDLFLGKE